MRTPARRLHHPFLSSLLVSVIAALVAGCSGDDDDDDTPSGQPFPGSQVVWIGDSYLTVGDEGIRHGVEARARDAGALAEGDEYRAYYAPGTQIANGQIPGQYDTAKAADPVIDTVVMDGGGNDIQGGHPECLSDPPPGNPDCVAVFDDIIATLESLWMTMGSDGIGHVVFFYYPELGDPGATANVDYSAPRIEAACEAFVTPLSCHFVDPRATFEGQPYIDDGIHPNADGQEALAGLIWEEMVANDIAQPIPPS